MQQFDQILMKIFGQICFIILIDFGETFIAPEFLTGELKRNLDRLCPENEIIAVKNKSFNDMSKTILEQIDPIPLLKEEFVNDVIDIMHKE